MKKIVSIIIPSYNSERTIEKTILSIRSQKIDQKNLEILVIDGGSTDNTIKIAKKYGSIILINKKIQQEYAKYIGLLKSNSKYVLFLDSDEQLSSKYSISKRLQVISSGTSAHIIYSSGYKPTVGTLINDYVASFGDPFAYFMYNTSPNFKYYINDCKNRYKNYTEAENYVSFKIDKKSHLPLVDLCAGVMVDMNFVRKNYNLKSDVLYVPQLPSLIIRKDGNFVVVKNDYIIHDSAENYQHFVNKLKWRAIVNIHYKNIPGTGYSNRESLQPKWFNIKKYLFIPYALSIIGPIYTTLHVLIFRRKKSALLHIPLSIYVALSIVKNIILKYFGYKPTLHLYGKVKKNI